MILSAGSGNLVPRNHSPSLACMLRHSQALLSCHTLKYYLPMFDNRQFGWNLKLGISNGFCFVDRPQTISLKELEHSLSSRTRSREVRQKGRVLRFDCVRGAREESLASFPVAPNFPLVSKRSGAHNNLEGLSTLGSIGACSGSMNISSKLDEFDIRER